MIDPTYLVHLLTYLFGIPNARCLVADDGLVSVVWSKLITCNLNDTTFFRLSGTITKRRSDTVIDDAVNLEPNSPTY